MRFKGLKKKSVPFLDPGYTFGVPRLTLAFKHMIELPLGSVSMKKRVLSSGWNPYDFDIKGMPLQDIVGLRLSAQGDRHIFAQSSIFGTSQRTLFSHFVDIYFSHIASSLGAIREKSKRVLFVLATVSGLGSRFSVGNRKSEIGNNEVAVRHGFEP